MRPAHVGGAHALCQRLPHGGGGGDHRPERPGLGAAAAGLRLHLELELRDVVLHPPSPASFDVIVVTRFLDRGLVPAITAALRPDGLVYYQTFTRDKLDGAGPSNPDYLLGRNELLKLFATLTILYYREDGRVGDIGRGNRNEAMLVAQKG